MKNDFIYLTEVLEQMRTLDSEGRAVKFDISYRTFNRHSKTGGKLNYHENAKLVMQEQPVKKYDGNISSLMKSPGEKKEIHRKNPNHFKNRTRNIRLENGDIKKVNIQHIITFNGQKVIY